MREWLAVQQLQPTASLIHVAAEIHVLLAEKSVTLNCLHRATTAQAERRYSG